MVIKRIILLCFLFVFQTSLLFGQDTIVVQNVHWNISSCELDSVCENKLKFYLPDINDLNTLELLLIEAWNEKFSAVYTSCRIKSLENFMNEFCKIKFDKLTPITKMYTSDEYSKYIKNNSPRQIYIVIHRN